MRKLYLLLLLRGSPPCCGGDGGGGGGGSWVGARKRAISSIVLRFSFYQLLLLAILTSRKLDLTLV